MIQRDYITQDELSRDCTADLLQCVIRDGRKYLPLCVGLDPTDPKRPTTYREAIVKRVKVLDDQGVERTAVVMMTPVILAMGPEVTE